MKPSATYSIAMKVPMTVQYIAHRSNSWDADETRKTGEGCTDWFRKGTVRESLEGGKGGEKKGKPGAVERSGRGAGVEGDGPEKLGEQRDDHG
jgi:hypothetical protein